MVTKEVSPMTKLSPVLGIVSEATVTKNKSDGATEWPGGRNIPTSFYMSFPFPSFLLKSSMWD